MARKGIPRSLMLPASTDAKLNSLCAKTGLNRNALIKLFAEKATVNDVRDLINR